MRHLSKEGIDVKKLNAKLAKHAALLTVNAHLLRRFEVTLPKRLDAAALRWLSEQLVLMNREWLDELTEALTGKPTVSATREAAAQRCLEAAEATAGILFERPLRVSTVGLPFDSDSAPSSTTKTKEKTMTQDNLPLQPGVQPMPTEPRAKADKPAPKKKVPMKKAPSKKGPPPIRPDLGKTKIAPKKGGVKHGELKIVTLTKGGENPRVEGTDGWKHFELYKKAKTVQALFDAVKPADRHKTRIRLNTDRRDGYVKLVKPGK